jgi:putative ABC transport system permease protein
MRHPLNWLLRAGMRHEDRIALLGDLAEEYRGRTRARRGWLVAQAWYSGQILAALAFSMKDGIGPSVDDHGKAGRFLRRVSVGGDVRHALHRWRHRPGFALTAIATLALGIGATTALYSVVHAVLLAPLPWTSPDRLVAIHAVFPDRQKNPASAATWDRGRLSWPAWDALRQHPVFDVVAVWSADSGDPTTFGEARAEIVSVIRISSNFLPMLGARIAQGRPFVEAEDDRTSDSVILTHEAWQRHFGGRADIIGQAMFLGAATTGDQAKKTIVGVLEPGFRFENDPPEFLLPVGLVARSRSMPFARFRVVARLAPGVAIEAATAAAESMIRAVETEEPTTVRVIPLADDQLRDVGRPLWLLFGAAGLLLLVACSNVAGLLLGDARARRHEFAVRGALGGTRGRVARQLLVEYGLLAVVGAVAGLVLAVWLTRMFVAVAPDALPRLATVIVDLRIAIFAIAIGLFTLLLFGLAPAVSLARTPAAAVLAEGGRDGAAGRHLGQRVVVAGTISLALVLLVGASLFGETMYRLTSRPLGFDPSHLAIVTTRFTGIPWGSGDAFVALQRSAKDFSQRLGLLTASIEASRTGQILENLLVIPGVLGAAGASHIPFNGTPRTIGIRVEGNAATDVYQVQQHVVTEDFFRVMRMPIVKGRGFALSDGPGGHSAVVSHEFERLYLEDRAVGRRFTYTWGPQEGQVTIFHVVGVVTNVKHREFADDDAAAFYVFNGQHSGVAQFVVRTSGDAAAVLPRMRQAIRDVDPQVVVTATDTVERLTLKSIAEERFRASLSALFGGASLVLAAVGLYGLAARLVADRRREFGVRVALGAQPRDVRRLVLRDALWTVGLGLLAGVPAAALATQVTRTMLFGVTPSAPHVFVIAAAVLALAALVATLLPARRAARIDPMIVLKEP